MRRFHDEALAASRLNHPNVVSVFDADWRPQFRVDAYPGYKAERARDFLFANDPWFRGIAGDVLPKLAGGHESHGAPPGTYLALAPLTFWPGSLMMGAGAWWAWTRPWSGRTGTRPVIETTCSGLVPQVTSGGSIAAMVPEQKKDGESTAKESTGAITAAVFLTLALAVAGLFAALWVWRGAPGLAVAVLVAGRLDDLGGGRGLREQAADGVLDARPSIDQRVAVADQAAVLPAAHPEEEHWDDEQHHQRAADQAADLVRRDGGGATLAG